MKKVLSTLLVACVALLIQSCGPSQQEAIDFNNKIVDIEKRTEVIMTKFFEDFDPETAGSPEIMKKAIADIAQCKKDLQDIPDLKGGEAFKTSGVEMLTAYETFFKTNVQTWVNAMVDPNRTEESLDAAQTEFEKATESVKVIEDKFETTQTEFAKLYGFELK
jgi:hypothetical protein